MKIQVQNGEELRRVAAEIVLNVTPRNVATTIALSGELGAGKTTFVQEIARALGVSETVSSPTFVIEKIYPIRDAARSNGAGDMNVHFKQLIHIDTYRLKSAEELKHLGWEEIVADSGNLICIEWPERVIELIPEGAVRISFEIEGERRIITIDGEESGGNKE